MAEHRVDQVAAQSGGVDDPDRRSGHRLWCAAAVRSDSGVRPVTVRVQQQVDAAQPGVGRQREGGGPGADDRFVRDGQAPEGTRSRARVPGDRPRRRRPTRSADSRSVRLCPSILAMSRVRPASRPPAARPCVPPEFRPVSRSCSSMRARGGPAAIPGCLVWRRSRCAGWRCSPCWCRRPRQDRLRRVRHWSSYPASSRAMADPTRPAPMTATSYTTSRFHDDPSSDRSMSAARCQPCRKSAAWSADQRG